MKTYQIAGIGNAIVDVIATVDDHFLDHMGIHKGIMQLVERDRAETLYGAMKDRAQASGGSVANTLAGVGALGLKAAFVGRVRDDALGRFYAADSERVGTHFANLPVADGELPTSRSMIFVTPDGERSMNTYLGISAEISPDDVDAALMADSAIVFLEGYLFDKDKGKAAFLKAARACRDAGGLAGIALSDPFCVDRHRDDFRALVAQDMDYVIGNEQEWVSLYQANDLDDALVQAAAACDLVVCTRSGDPVRIIRNGEETEIPVKMVTPVDATGAGDQFAAGFLFGLANGADMATAGRMGCIAAAEVISHIGARPKSDLLAIFRAEGLI
ncbi:adenosine kinase [Roseicitreum antarcticum]|uniref:Sugar or nucleoside kinase, ribokinase family n=1 Tax=Roseicitreum antarcticum TaxID=564137 RepID=A0A1H2RU48_9RHOB|nr:adenosine kinase [Roseicitreum antarcticum]SDW22710.1 Sugar or nucleoside kinase, ribokinase family [Roseicitreum antarcticum]